MLSLPSALAVVGAVDSLHIFLSRLTCVPGIVPGVILIVFLGVFGLFTAKLLIDFKHNHPEVHNMGTRSPHNIP